MTRMRAQCFGFVSVELSACIALLLLPVAMLVVSVPSWSSREHAATVIAREAARLTSDRWPAVDDVEVDEMASELATNLGVDPGDVVVQLSEIADRGQRVRATVTIRMPALHIPGVGSIGQWHWTTSSAVLVDPYRSR